MLAGCLKDNPLTADNFITTDTINMLTYLESNGDIINSRSTLSTFLNAQDLYSNLSNYVILDIRDPQLFADGHISGAINVQSSDLLTKVKSSGSSNVILVSQNGQSASYYGGLVRLDGLNNVYVLKFGMAGWNSHFAGPWDQNNGLTPSGFKYFNNAFYNRGPYTNLPSVNLSGSGDIKSKIETRIQSLLSEKFDDGINLEDSSLLTAKSVYVFNEGIYFAADSTFGDQYIACYDTFFVYQEGGSRDVTIPMHPPHSVLYTYYNDLKSVYYLQTIPSNKKVVMYSKSGHQSAFATAYLRLLGYNARSLLFGATWLSPFPGSMNYPYVN
jgi:rhodanese-related sulfurtransferase